MRKGRFKDRLLKRIDLSNQGKNVQNQRCGTEKIQNGGGTTMNLLGQPGKGGGKVRPCTAGGEREGQKQHPNPIRGIGRLTRRWGVCIMCENLREKREKVTRTAQKGLRRLAQNQEM